jgi:hypothetical protein
MELTATRRTASFCMTYTFHPLPCTLSVAAAHLVLVRCEAFPIRDLALGSAWYVTAFCVRWLGHRTRFCAQSSMASLAVCVPVYRIVDAMVASIGTALATALQLVFSVMVSSSVRWPPSDVLSRQPAVYCDWHRWVPRFTVPRHQCILAALHSFLRTRDLRRNAVVLPFSLSYAWDRKHLTNQWS